MGQYIPLSLLVDIECNYTSYILFFFFLFHWFLCQAQEYFSFTMAAIITVGVNRAAPGGGDSQKCTSCSQTFACLAGQGFSMIWTGLTATAYEKDLNSSLCYPLWSIEMLHASLRTRHQFCWVRTLHGSHFFHVCP